MRPKPQIPSLGRPAVHPWAWGGWQGRWGKGSVGPAEGRRREQLALSPQHSDSDSDPEYASLPSSIPSAVPVTGESFCDCDSQSEAFCGSLHAAHRGRDCRCGEEDECECGGLRRVGGPLGWVGAWRAWASSLTDFDWVWDDLNKSSATLLSCDNRKVNFHMEYSCGTAAIRGTKELGEGQHFWEIKMTSPVYGTDMVSGRQGWGRGAGHLGPQPPLPVLPFPDGGHRDIGRGPGQVPPHVLQPARPGRGQLGPLLHGCVGPPGWAGLGGPEAAGLTPTLLPPGLLHHKGDKMSFSSRFGQGSIIGVHLDTWHGTLTFFKNRKCIGEEVTLTCARKA